MNLYHKSYGAGEPLLILHGLLGASGNWHTLSRTKFGEQFHVFALDLRNHGKSPHSEVFDYPSMAGDVEAFIKQHGLASVTVLGHSMGGKVAMRLALEHPDLVRRLIVADIAPRAYPPHHTHILKALRRLDLSAHTSRTEIDRALAQDIKEMPVRQFLLKNLESQGGNGYRWKMNLPVISEQYPNINVEIETGPTYQGPTLFIKGGQSNYISEVDLPHIRALFPQVTIEEIPGAGHWVHAEAPEAFADRVLAFTDAANQG